MKKEISRNAQYENDKIVIHSSVLEKENEQLKLKIEALKKDKAYSKVISLVQTLIQESGLEGQKMLGDKHKIKFEEGDLKYALHGIKKIEFSAAPVDTGHYHVQIKLLDVYDFDPKDYQVSYTWPILHMADVLEASLILKNFEIEIQITETISTSYE